MTQQTHVGSPNHLLSRAFIPIQSFITDHNYMFARLSSKYIVNY